MGLNQFSDLTLKEFKTLYTSGALVGLDNYYNDDADADAGLSFEMVGVGDELPAEVDWRKAGAVAPVKDQLMNGTCWAFAAIATVEALHFMATGQMVTLSEQNVIDCDKKLNLWGWSEGIVRYAYLFILLNGGVDSDIDYPYTGRPGVCDRTRVNKVATIDGFRRVRKYDEHALKVAVSRQPVAALIDSEALLQYTSGIVDGEWGCLLDHYITIVGYGTENGIDFWICRNSWGPDWGEGGYFRIARNVKDPRGQCGIATFPSYPLKLGVNVHETVKPKPTSLSGCDSCGETKGA